MVTQEQVLKANPLVLHNQSLLMARQRALSMQTLCWHPIPSAPGLQLCYFPEEQQFPVPAQGSVAFQGLLTARFYTGVKAATECGCQQAPCSQGHSQGCARLPPPVAPGHTQHLGLLHREVAKLNQSWLWGFKSSYECYRASLCFSLDKKLLDWTLKEAGTDSWKQQLPKRATPQNAAETGLTWDPSWTLSPFTHHFVCSSCKILAKIVLLSLHETMVIFAVQYLGGHQQF